ncbi:MAG: hypothetical protein L6Q54_14505 [Leptospiraceae bacterium]|nr:hypothetical protein [Leptospiraceae bacterium]MCK6382444.1 hypothetical protein [Leptospiraceae bacterium]NUM41395.1 hypothetical protein [Leptospiraceae bacterium]
MQFFLIFSLLLIAPSLLELNGESYSGHRLDDRLYVTGGRKKITQENRMTSIKEFIDTSSSNEGFRFYNLNFLNTNFYSQKGGDSSQKARQYSISGNISPEWTLAYTKNILTAYLVVSPILSYTEKNRIKKEVLKKNDFEALGGIQINFQSYSFNLEYGRGFQRLDSFGLFFSGISNFISLTSFAKNPKISLSFLGASFESRNNIPTTYENIYRANKLYGSSILIREIPLIDWVSVFTYKLYEPMQVARQEGFHFAKQDFYPLGNFLYSGIEIESEPIQKLAKSDIGFISVKGFRDMGEYSNQKYDSKISTSAYIAYLQERFELKKFELRIGLLKSSKDKNSNTDRESNGYSAPLSSPRIFGGRSSFLLNENIEPLEEKIFSDAGELKKSNFENKGIQITNLSMTLHYSSNFEISVLVNHSQSRIGIGKEIILLGEYRFGEFNYFKNSFLLFSACIANVQTYKQNNIFFNEIKESKFNQEFLRFYFSGVLAF